MRISRLIEVLLWALAAYAIASNQTTIIITLLTAIWGDPAQTPPVVLQNLSYVSPAFPLLLGILAIVRLAIAGTDLGALFGFSARRLPGDLVLGALVGVVSVGVTALSLRIASSYVELPPLEQFPVSMHLYFATVGAFIPGIFEELYFRGLLFRVGASVPKALLVVISAAAFAAWHIGTPAYLPHTFILGLIWGSLFAATGRLAPSIIAHITANAGFGVLLLTGYSLTAGG